MEYYGKNLPKGFIYLVTKKDLLEINDLVENSIIKVKLDRTSFSESKMSYKLWSKSVLYIHSYLVETKVCFTLTQFGIKKSNFANNDELLIVKQTVISEIIKVIKTKNEDFQKNRFTSKTAYISINIPHKDIS